MSRGPAKLPVYNHYATMPNPIPLRETKAVLFPCRAAWATPYVAAPLAARGRAAATWAGARRRGAGGALRASVGGGGGSGRSALLGSHEKNVGWSHGAPVCC